MRIWAACVWLLSGVVFWGGCGRRDPYAGKKIFRYNEPAGITSLDPAYASNLPNIQAVLQLYNGLVKMDDSLRIRPSLAKRWYIDPGGREYTFHLRTDVFFHDDACFPGGNGRKMVAQDVVFSLQRLSVTGSGAWIMTSVAGESGDKSIRAVDDSTVMIELKAPYRQFLQLLANPHCGILAPESVTAYGADVGFHPVGTGPFFLIRWVENEKMVLRKNERYFMTDKGQRLPYLDGISISFLKDKQTAFLDFAEGKTDFISGIDPAYKDQLVTPLGMLKPHWENEVNMYRCPYLLTEYLGINMERSSGTALENRHVRMALSYALDRGKILRNVRNGIGIPALQGIVPPGIPVYKSAAGDITWTENKDSVITCLHRAGYKSPHDVGRFILVTDVAYSDIATVIANQWRNAGFDCELEVNDRPTLRSKMSKGTILFFRASWIADYPDAENFMALFYRANFAPDGPNYTRYSSPVVDRYYEQLRDPLLPDSLSAIYRNRIDSAIRSDVPVIPLFYDEVVRFARKNIQGVEPNPLNYLFLEKVKKE